MPVLMWVDHRVTADVQITAEILTDRWVSVAQVSTGQMSELQRRPWETSLGSHGTGRGSRGRATVRTGWSRSRRDCGDEQDGRELGGREGRRRGQVDLESLDFILSIVDCLEDFKQKRLTLIYASEDGPGVGVTT